MDLKSIREHLGRVKLYYQRNETLRALGEAVMGVKGLVDSGVVLPMEIRGILREAVQYLARDEAIKQMLKGPLLYQPGQERQLLTALASLYKQLLAEQDNESYEEAFARKQKLDFSLNQGMRALAQGQASEADEFFSEAVKLYKNEHVLFRLIGEALVNAGEVRRAIPYIRKGLEVAPTDMLLPRLMDQALRARNG